MSAELLDERTAADAEADARPDDETLATDELALDLDDTEELLVEEISIDGMCGVY